MGTRRQGATTRALVVGSDGGIATAVRALASVVDNVQQGGVQDGDGKGRDRVVSMDDLRIACPGN